MKELSLNILDIAQNSFAVGAPNTSVVLDETDDTLRITVSDDGCGMSPETLKKVSDPFFTTRTTRKVGLGIPLFRLAAEQTGGYVNIKSSQSGKDRGTVTEGLFYKKHIDFTPLGDIVSTVCSMMQGCGENNLLFVHRINGKEVRLDSRELRSILGDIPLSVPEVQQWIRGYLEQQYDEIKKNNNI